MSMHSERDIETFRGMAAAMALAAKISTGTFIPDKRDAAVAAVEYADALVAALGMAKEDGAK
jgi:hypothetical protein